MRSLCSLSYHCHTVVILRRSLPKGSAVGMAMPPTGLRTIVIKQTLPCFLLFGARRNVVHENISLRIAMQLDQSKLFTVIAKNISPLTGFY